MAEPSTKDRDPNLLTGETSSPCSVSLEHTNKGRNKPIEKKFNSANGHKKQSKKTTEVSLDNLQDAELQALLDEVVQYRGPRDGEKGTELFQALLKETQESGEESPPAFRATQNSTSQSTIQRRRRSRKESNRFPHPSVTPPTHSTTVAGSNRKGGSLQNISTHHQSECPGVRQRRRYDASNSGSTSGSRKREGGSLPCDVARGSLNSTKSDEPCKTGLREEDDRPAKHQISDESLVQHCVINMEGVAEVNAKTFYESSGLYSEQWKHHNARHTNSSSITDSYEPMEQDQENSPSDKSCLTKMNTTNSNKNYGTMACKSLDVDAGIPIPTLEASTATRESNRAVILNGSAGEDSLRRARSRNGGGNEGTTDENGNPFPYNGSAMRTSPSSMSMGNALGAPTSNQGSSGLKAGQRKNGKKRGKDSSNAFLSDELPGFVGHRGVDELLKYIESSSSSSAAAAENNGGKKSMDGKKGGAKNVSSSKESSGKVKSSKEKKSTAKSLLRHTDSNQADSEDSDSGAGEGSPSSPIGKDDGGYVFKSKSDGADELDAAVAAAADFQTVTKKQRRKKRNSLSNANIGAMKSKELLEQSQHLFNNASSSPSVMMRPPRHQATAGGSSSSGSQTGSVSSGSGGIGASRGDGNAEPVKKLVASVPPSEPSDLDSDGGDSVHSLPVQPSGPLFASSAPPAATSVINSSSISGSSQASACVSYADIIRSDLMAKCEAVSFLAESSQPVDIKQPSASGGGAATAAMPPVAPTTTSFTSHASSHAADVNQAVNVPCNTKSSAPKSISSAPLRRAASLPPTSPSCADAPPVVMFGTTSTSAQVDVTFGFEINEQLLALSFHPPSRTEMTAAAAAKTPRPDFDSADALEVSFSPEPDAQIDKAPIVVASPSPAAAGAVDFASRYRERPELLNAPLSRRSYEIVDFISQAWKRIERKLDEQHKHGVASSSSSGLSFIRVYTLE